MHLRPCSSLVVLATYHLLFKEDCGPYRESDCLFHQECFINSKVTTIFNVFSACENFDPNIRRHISFSSVPMGVGRGQGGPRSPWILKILAKNGCFVVSNGKKTNFTTFGPLLEKFWKKPLVPPLKISFRRPWLYLIKTSCKLPKS